MKSSELENQLTIRGEYIELDPNRIRHESNTYSKISFFNLEECDLITKFGNYTNMLKESLRTKKYFCIPNDKINLSLNGNWEENFNPGSFLVLSISNCLNDSSNENQLAFSKKDCFEKKIIEKNFNNFFINVIYLNHDIDHNDFYNPGKLLVKSEAFPFNSSVFNIYHFKKKF